MSTLEYTKGIAQNEQDLARAARDFAVNQCGWELYDTPSDTSSDAWFILKTPGSDPELRPFYGEFRGSSDFVNLNAAYGWDIGAQDWSDGESLYDATATRTEADGDLYYHFFGDIDGIWFVWWLKNEDGWYSSYLGYFDSFYSNEDEDYLPICCIGQRYESRWFDETRIRVFGPWTLSSGDAWGMEIHKDIYTSGYARAAPGTLNGSVMLSRLIMRNGSEVRGALKYIKGVSGAAMVTNGGWITVTGTNHKYFTCGYNRTVDEWAAYGPVDTASGTDWAL